MRSFAAAPLAFIAIFFASLIGMPFTGCLSQTLLGIRCPGCGVTRSILALLHGDFAAAMAFNIAGPLVFVSFAIYLACFLLAAFGRQRSEVLLRWSLRSDRVMMVSLITAWLWHGGNEWLR